MSKYPTRKCVKCGYEVTTNVVKKHEKVCDGSGIKSKKHRAAQLSKYVRNDENLAQCPTCFEWFSPRGISSHIRSFHEGNKFLFRNGQTWNKGLTKLTDKRVKKNSEAVSKALKGKPGWKWNDEQKKAQSLRKIELYKQFPEKHPNRKVAGNKSKMTYPEQICYDWLTQNKIEFEHNFKFNNWYIDFKINKILIEIDGEHWHQDKEKDAKRDAILTLNGFKVFRIKAKENIEQKLAEYIGV